MTQPDALVATTLGGCQILEVIGRGGMGVIYKARQLSLDRIVAMKVLSPKLANDLSFVTRFQREARAIARVNHPNILAVYDVGNDRDIHYMIMELIDGESVAELQARLNGPLRFEDACNYIKQAAQGLEAAHAAGITHRDVKPENLLLTRKGIIKVSDFGLAKEADTSTTSTDAVMGTPAFMSPEQCDGRKVTNRSDIYSLGGSFYRLVTGRLPFEAETAMSMMYRHKHEALVPPKEIVPALSKSVSDLIVKMMAKKAEERFPSMGEVVAAIDRSLAAGMVEPPRRRERPPPEELEIILPPAPPPKWAAEPAGQPVPPEGSEAATAPPRGASARFAAGGGLTERFPRGEFARGQAGSAGSSGHLAPGLLAGLTDDAFSLARHGDELLQKGDRAGAIKLYRQAIQLGQLDGATQQRLEKELLNEAVARRQAGEELLRRGMLMEASREFRLLLDLDPKDEAVKASLKEIEQKLATKRTLINDIRSAIGAQQFEQAIAMWDRTPLDLREEGLAKEIKHLRTVIVPSVKLCEQGENYNNQGRLEEALSTFQDALRIDETCERARQGLGDVQSKLHRIELMLKEGYELSLKQDYGRAIEAWKPILRLRPGHPQTIKSIIESTLALAQAERSAGNLRNAIKVLGGAREVDPQNRSVGRLYEELQELSEKEQALTDRATEAAAQGRAGEAIRYWGEVLRINPANATAQEQIRTLGKERSKRLLRVSAAVFVVAVVFLAGYQYIIEFLALRKVEECMRETVPDCQTALAVLDDTYFLYCRSEVPARRRRIKLLEWEIDAARLEEQGDLVRSASVLDQAADSPESGDQAQRLKQKATELRAKDRVNKGNALLGMKEPELAKARDEFEQGRRLALEGRLSALIVLCDKSLLFIQKVEKALEARQEKRLPEYIRALQEALALRPDNVFVKEHLDGSGYNAQQFDAQIKTAVQALAQPERPEALGEAVAALERARAANPIGPRLEVLSRFAADAQKCAAAGMVLVTNRRPENPDLAWLGGDRREAICIDRYEFPNRAGEVPRSGQTWLEAKAQCEKGGKQLCTWQQWYKACGAKDFSIWTFGAKEIAGACNWGGPEGGAQAKPSGSFSQCHNQIGAFDMNGNLAEWTLDGAQENEAYQAGGSFSSGGPRAARCVELDRVSRPRNAGPPDVGFRCCKPLDRE